MILSPTNAMKVAMTEMTAPTIEGVWKPRHLMLQPVVDQYFPELQSD